MFTQSDAVHAAATRKAMIRLLPILGIAYFMSYVDRTNISLAKTSLGADIGVSAAAYGTGAGIFFISYALLEIPSNLAVYRIGARVWITRIAVSWGLVAAAMMFAQGVTSFYVLRFVLGAAEAGLYPALMYTVTLWFSQRHRMLVVGLVYLAPATATIFGAPAGGWLMTLEGKGGLHGWQWMFMVEGLLTVLIGVLVWFTLPDRPQDAKWLTSAEATALTERAVGDGHERSNGLRSNLRSAFGQPLVIVISAVYFMNQVVSSAIGFNLPSIVQGFGFTDFFVIGWVTGSLGVPLLAGVLFFPWLHGRIGKDTSLILICAVAATAAMSAYLAASSAGQKFALLAVADFFLAGTLPLFWSVAMSRMSGVAAAMGLAYVNTIGLLGSFFGPVVFGMVEHHTGNERSPFIVIIGAGVAWCLLAGVLKWVAGRTSAVETAPVPVTAAVE